MGFALGTAMGFVLNTALGFVLSTALFIESILTLPLGKRVKYAYHNNKEG